ncbi:MAG: type II secretion system minor pseudopilin GspK [Pseudomonas sp.]|uniref:type II secretion system minor pseudopilin GspK n=1 Tax=Pseudomonas sp. TaxID=306 RepID=UPI0030EFBEFA
MLNAKRQQGFALITVLLITALVTLIISDMLARQRLTLYSTANQTYQKQMWQMALSGEAWARQRLIPAATEKPQLDTTNLAQPWAQPTPAFEMGEGKIHIQLEDLSARFNLNTLQARGDLIARARYQRLLNQLGVTPHDPSILPALLGADEQPLPFANSSELQRLPELASDALQRLAPWVTTQKNTAINVNTVGVPVLASIEGIDLSVAKALVQSRPKEGYASVQAFLANPLLLGRNLSSNGLSVRSKDFLATIDVELGERSLRLLSTLHLDNGGQAIVLYRTLTQIPPSKNSESTAP